MSAVAVSGTPSRGASFYRTTLGKKAVMAVTGVILFGFLIAHMGANLLFFAGPEALNGYAVSLRDMAPLLWFARLALLVSVILHIVASIQLARLQSAARPVGYARKKNVGSNYASRTMMWSGPIIAAFIVYHLMHLTWGVSGLPFEHLRPYDNLVAGFSKPLVSIAYVIAVIMLGAHLYHGLWSMFQTMGVAHPRYTPKLKLAAKALTTAIVLGFIAVPIAILLGVRHESTML